MSSMQLNDSITSDSDKTKVGELLCSYKYRICNRACVPAFPYCDAHILEDPSMPFIQCQFYYKTGDRQCHNPVYNPSGLKYCDEHLSFACEDDLNQHPDSPSSSISIDSESRRNLLSHQKKLKRIPRHSGSFHVSTASSPTHSNFSKSGPPSPIPPLQTTLLSEWERHAGSNTMMDESWSSDANSVDSEDEDLLKRASVFTKTEIINQSMLYWQKYIDLCKDELGQLNRKLRKSYAVYMKEKSSTNQNASHSTANSASIGATANATTGASNSSSASGSREAKHDPKSRAFKELKELRRFNQKSGKEYSLQRFGQIYKFGLFECNKSGKASRTCQYKDNLSTTSRKCNQKTLPCSAFCLEHIVRIDEIEVDSKDKQHQQFLLRQCDQKDCKSPVVNWHPSSSVPVMCRYHTQLCQILPDCPTSQRSLVQDVLKSSNTKLKETIADQFAFPTNLDCHKLLKQEFPTEQDFSEYGSAVTSSPIHSIFH